MKYTIYRIYDTKGNIVKIGHTQHYPQRPRGQLNESWVSYDVYETFTDTPKKEVMRRERVLQKRHGVEDGCFIRSEKQRGHTAELGKKNTLRNSNLILKASHEKVVCCIFCRAETNKSNWNRHLCAKLDKKLSESPITLIPMDEKLHGTFEPIHLSSYRDWAALGLADSSLRRLLEGSSRAVVVPTRLGRTKWVSARTNAHTSIHTTHPICSTNA